MRCFLGDSEYESVQGEFRPGKGGAGNGVVRLEQVKVVKLQSVWRAGRRVSVLLEMPSLDPPV